VATTAAILTVNTAPAISVSAHKSNRNRRRHGDLLSHLERHQFQWRKNGNNITGANSSSYTTPALSLSDSGSTFDVIVSNGCGTPLTSNSATLTVNLATCPSFNPVLQGQNKNSTTWFAGQLLGWKELDYINARVLFCGGDVGTHTITITFPHTKTTGNSVVKGIETYTTSLPPVV